MDNIVLLTMSGNMFIVTIESTNEPALLGPRTLFPSALWLEYKTAPIPP
jgi:hypothetical protein